MPKRKIEQKDETNLDNKKQKITKKENEESSFVEDPQERKKKGRPKKVVQNNLP